jgi:hypothetical protein
MEINWVRELKDEGSTYIKNVFSIREINLLEKIINHMKKTENIYSGMNPFVTNKNRSGGYIGGYTPGKQVRLTKNGKLIIKIFQNKFKKYFKEIFKNKNHSSIYFENTMYFECFPNCEEQEIHLDITINNRDGNRLNFWEESKKGESGAYIIIIPLTDSTTEMGSTNYYKTKFWNELTKNELEELYAKQNNSINSYNKNNFGYLKDWSGSIRNKLEKNKKIKDVFKGDIQIQNTMSLHAGGKNKTNKIRKYILQWVVFSKNNINILNKEKIIKI